MSDSRGYAYYDKTEKRWYVRVTVTAENDSRRNIKKRAKSKPEAREVLKALIRKLDDELDLPAKLPSKQKHKI